jgi:hypothetical protein
VSLRRLIFSVCVVCLCVAIGTIAVLRVTGPRGTRALRVQAASKAPISIFAYTTERQLVLYRGNRAIAKVSRIFDERDSLQDKVVWTNDGDYIAFLKNVTLLQESASEEELIAINTETGAIKHYRCPGCYDIAPVETESIYAAGADPYILKFDLNSRINGKRTRFQLPGGSTSGISLLAGSQDYFLTNRQVLIGSGGQRLDMIDLHNGTDANLGVFPSNSYMFSAVAEAADGSSTSIAVAFRQAPGACAAQFPIYVFAPGGSYFLSDISAAVPHGHLAGIDSGLQVNDLWWGLDGHFHAAIESWTCNPSRRTEQDKQIPSARSSVWTLDGRNWVATGEPATMARQLNADSRIRLVIPDCIGPGIPKNPIIYCNTGTLFLDNRNRNTVIATGVISVTAPAARNAHRPTSRDTPILGQLTGTFIDGTGFGHVKPGEVYNGGDPTGLVSKISWKSWGGQRAIGVGQSEYADPKLGVAYGRIEAATIVAFDLGDCDGVRMYRAVEWYFPQHGGAFNPARYEDICKGTYRGEA